jgi:hypothetical protein
MLALAVPRGHAGPPGEGYDFQVWPVWQGYVKTGAAGFELALRFIAPTGGQARLSVRGSGIPVDTVFTYEPGRAVSLRIPLLLNGGNGITVRLQANGRQLERQLELQQLAASKNLAAIVVHHNSEQWSLEDLSGNDLTLVHLVAEDLPHNAVAYQQLSALVLSESALAALEPAQQEALAGYLANCGTLYLPARFATSDSPLRAQAGCGGRYVMAAMPGNRSDWLPTGPGGLPGAAALRQALVDVNTGLARPLLVFLVGYLGMLLLLARSANSVLLLLALPPAATAMALLAWSLSSPIVDVSAWAEMESGDAQARYSALARVTGTSRREVSIDLPAQWGVPLELGNSAATGLHLGVIEKGLPGKGSTAEPLQLSLSTRLMSRHEFLFTGVTPGPRLDVRERAETVSVRNLGNRALPAGVVAWRGLRYSLPGLAPGEQWQAPERGEPWGRQPGEQLLRQRAIDGSTWLLTPFRLPAQASGVSGTGWLLVKGVADA